MTLNLIKHILEGSDPLQYFYLGETEQDQQLLKHYMGTHYSSSISPDESKKLIDQLQFMSEIHNGQLSVEMCNKTYCKYCMNSKQ